MGLTHLSFGDNLIIFTDCTTNSYRNICNRLEDFYCISRLKLNSAKTEIFTIGVPYETTVALADISSFQQGNLPVRYLRIPLISTKLRYQDCQGLIDRITTRARSWTAQTLSYVGRAQLIFSVLQSMSQFWCAHFILLKKVISRIRQICAGFLWKGHSDSAKGAKMKWADLCFPRSEGELGFKDLITWNSACIIKNIWMLLVSSGSIWVAWAHKYLVRFKCIWLIKIPNSCSWS